MQSKNVGKTNLIVACERSGGIGLANKLLWPFSTQRTDMVRFKVLTTGCPVVMGRVTHESIGRALPGRTNIVLTSNRAYVPLDAGVEIARSLRHGLQIARAIDIYSDRWIIGGASVYAHAISERLVDQIYLSEVDAALPADTFFSFSLSSWEVKEEVRHLASPGNLHPVTYKRLVLRG